MYLIVMWIHRLLGHVQEAGSFFDTADWSQPVNCSCGKTWYW